MRERLPSSERDGSASDRVVSPPSPPVRSAGEPLEESVRVPLERHFGHDFGRVRVRADGAAAAEAQAVGAQAFTVGEEVVFDQGHYQPATDRGQRLLAHELAHVVQQRARGVAMQRRTPGLAGTEPWEREAEDAADQWGDRLHGGTLPYREAMETVIPQPVRPAAADLPDTRPRVLTNERAMFTDLRTFVTGLPAQLRQLVTTGSPGEPWLTAGNAYVQAALRTLDSLTSDLAAERFVLRFDQPAGTAAAASYDMANDAMHLRPFANNQERTVVAVDLLHEYAHVQQDRESEAVFARQRSPRVDTRAEDLQREVDARRVEVYVGEMLRVLRIPVPTNAIMGSQLSGMVFRGRFERERTGRTPAARRAATREIGQEIEQAYAGQLQRNSSVKRYAVELDRHNHALLHWDVPGQPTPRDLGAVPETFTSRQQLGGLLAFRIHALSEFARLFDRPGGQRLAVILVSVVWGQEQVTSFALEP